MTIGDDRFRDVFNRLERVIEDAAHFVFEDDPDRCVDEVVGFLRESA